MKKEHLGLERQAIKNTEEGRAGVRRVEGLLNAVQIAVYYGRSKDAGLVSSRYLMRSQQSGVYFGSHFGVLPSLTWKMRQGEAS